jgi:hypothetical protein
MKEHYKTVAFAADKVNTLVLGRSGHLGEDQSLDHVFDFVVDDQTFEYPRIPDDCFETLHR